MDNLACLGIRRWGHGGGPHEYEYFNPKVTFACEASNIYSSHIKNKGAISSLKSGEKKSPSSFNGSHFESSFFPLAYLSTTKINKNSQNQKNSFRKPQTPSPTLAKKKERERKGGRRGGLGGAKGEKISKEFKGEKWLPI